MEMVERHLDWRRREGRTREVRGLEAEVLLGGGRGEQPFSNLS